MGRSNQDFPWLNGTVLALRKLRVRDGFNSHRLHFIFCIYFIIFNLLFLFIILLGTQNDRAVAQVCQR